jgi:hypothetical protein
MPNSGSITPADLIGKLEWLNVSCDKCGRIVFGTDLRI